MSEADAALAVWLAALARFRETRLAFNDWKARNPYPASDQLPDDPDAAEACLLEWEKGSEAVGGPYCEAVETLKALPAPNLEAVIVKLELVREALDGYSIERELAPFLETIEQDLRHLAQMR
jgi:hypothetical protein